MLNASTFLGARPDARRAAQSLLVAPKARVATPAPLLAARSAVQTLLAAPITFSRVEKCYVLPDVGPKRGLTKILSAIMPIPRGEVADDEPPRKRARKSKNDPVPAPKVWYAVCPEQRYYQSRAAHSCRDATVACELSGLADDVGRAGIGSDYNRRHGSLVDEQLRLRVEHGAEALVKRKHGATRGGLDPCTATLFDFLASRNQRVAAAQIPVYSAEMDVATAFDIMTNDGAVYEIKSTTVTSPEAIKRGDINYETPRARLERTALRGTPCSQYGIGQLQLCITCDMITEVTGFTPTSAAVLRVSPGVVREYVLHDWFKVRAARFRRAIAQRTGQTKRAARERKHKKKIK